MIQGAEKVQKRPSKENQLSILGVVIVGPTYFFAGNLVPQSFWEREPIVVQWKP